MDTLRLVAPETQISSRSEPDTRHTVIELASEAPVAPDRFIRILVADDCPIVEVRAREVTLEEAFLSLTGADHWKTAVA